MLKARGCREGRRLRCARRDGTLHHAEIPPSHWCVTKSDLKKLRGAVLDNITSGTVKPTALDPFDPTDTLVGPCVHTIVDQMIKPISTMFGGSSWALLENPSGLKCDLFVSHSWAEGIFEFLDKVLHSWPQGAKHAYCCMLSNPQTLNIGAMIAHPEQSPFAQALQSATYVLVVPNRKGSVYTRVWCTYEAFLAYKWNKTITVASAPIPGLRLQMLLCFVLSCGSSLAAMLSIGTLSRSKAEAYCKRCVTLYLLMQYSVLVLSSHSFGSTRYWISVLGVVIGGFAYPLFIWSRYIPQVSNLSGSRDRFFLGCLSLVLILTAEWAFWFCSVYDVFAEESLRQEETQLARNYSGHVRDAQASVDHDKQMILDEIQKNCEEAVVDESINTLLKSGMSSRMLRSAYAKGVSIDKAGFIRWRYGAFALKAWAVSAYSTNLRISSSRATVLWAALLIYIFGLIHFRQRDKTAVASAAVWKLMGMPYLIAGIALFVFKPSIYEMWVHVSVYFACIAALVPFLNLGHVASIPVIGVSLAHVIVADNCLPCWTCCHATFFTRLISTRETELNALY